MSKRSNGEGTVFKNESTGKWVAQVTYYLDGKRHRKTKTSRTRADANANLRKLHDDIDNGLSASCKESVAKYLESWVEEYRQKGSINTYHAFKNIVYNHIIPGIGQKQLDKLSPMDVQNMINSMRINGVSSSNIQLSYNYLNQALRRAYKFRMIRENPCGPVDKPKHKPAKANPFNMDEAKALMNYLDGHHLYSICYTALTTGMRPGELFGLFWEHVDLVECEISIEQQLTFAGGHKYMKPPKTESSIRTISISDETASVLTEQRKHLVKSGFASSEYVFCGERGTPYARNNFDKKWKKVLKSAGVLHRGFHQMRHTFATMALSSGVPVTVVSETLGHASTAMTLDIYAHVLPTMKADATNAVSKLIG